MALATSQGNLCIVFLILVGLRYVLSELDVFYPGEVSGKVAVASFLKKRGLVFWDLFGGDKKKEYASEL